MNTKWAAIFGLNLIFLQMSSCAQQTPVTNDAEQDMALRASNSLKTALALGSPDTQRITLMILNKKFKEFEELSKSYEEGFSKNPLFETPLRKLYDAIYAEGAYRTDISRALDVWVETRPTYMSFAARGIFKANLGISARGYNYIANTSPKRITMMKQFHGEAMPDLLRAIKENPKFTPSYVSLLNILRASGDFSEAEKVEQLGINAVPNSFYIRYAFIQILTPRWGGSYSQMHKYIDSMRKDDFSNPRNWSLKGEVDAEKGLSAMLANQYESAIKFYTKALSYGDRCDHLKSRAYSYSQLKKYRLALDDYLHCKEIDKNDKSFDSTIEQLKSRLSEAQQL